MLLAPSAFCPHHKIELWSRPGAWAEIRAADHVLGMEFSGSPPHSEAEFCRVRFRPRPMSLPRREKESSKRQLAPPPRPDLRNSLTFQPAKRIPPL